MLRAFGIDKVFNMFRVSVNESIKTTEELKITERDFSCHFSLITLFDDVCDIYTNNVSKNHFIQWHGKLFVPQNQQSEI